MSVLSNLKAYLLRGAATESQEVKKAILDLYIEIDADLDDGYEPSTDVEEAVDNFNRILIQLGEAEEEIQNEDAEVAESSKTGDLPTRITDDDESSEGN